jgi:mono/diheme cytochrome c family protein
VLAVRIESHLPSIAARWSGPKPDLLCCSPVTRVRSSLRTLAAVVVAITIALAAAACTTSGGPPKPTNPALADGWQVFKDNCASCHGTSGEGGAGPKLAGTVVADFPNIGDQITVIENGKGGGAMPAWKGRLTSQQIEDVARYTRQCLGHPSC